MNDKEDNEDLYIKLEKTNIVNSGKKIIYTENDLKIKINGDKGQGEMLKNQKK
jgi:hypothetical protein